MKYDLNIRLNIWFAILTCYNYYVYDKPHHSVYRISIAKANNPNSMRVYRISIARVIKPKIFSEKKKVIKPNSMHN